MDNALIEMVREALAELEAHEIDTEELESWDRPLDQPGLTDEVQHSIGFVCGVAAGMDVTPRELIWSLPPAPAPAEISKPKPTTTKPRARRARKG